MNTKRIIILISIAFSCRTLACLPLDPQDEPALTFFGPVIFAPFNTEKNISGTAKALLSIDKNGNVIDAQIIKLNPDGIDPEPVLKAIFKAKFNVEREIKEYVYTFEFGE